MRSRPFLPFLVASLASAGLAGLAAAPASAAAPTARWQATAPGGWFAWGSPVIGDVNGDGSNDVVVGGENGLVYAYDANGTPLPGWPARATSAVASSPAIGDLDGDGKNEVVVGTGTLDQDAVNHGVGALDIFNGDGSLRCQKLMGTQAMASGVYGAPAIGDVTGDGINDVVFGSWDHTIYVLDGHCNTLAAIDNRDSVQSSPALYDVDGSGAMDIFIGGDATENTSVAGDSFNGGVFRRLHYDGSAGGPGSLREVWERRSQETFQSGAAIGDIDGDGRLEVVTGAGGFYCRTTNAALHNCADSNKVWAFHLDDGSNVPGWPKTATFNTTWNSAPALGDLDGDGIADVVVGSNGYDAGGNLAGGAVDAFYSRGGHRSFITGTPQQGGQQPGSPVIADVDGQPGNEVIVGNVGPVYVLSGSLANTGLSFTGSLPLNHLAAVAVGQLGAGRWAVVTTGYESSALPASRNGHVMAFSIAAPASAPWPMLGKNSQRLGSDVAAVVPIVCNSGYRLVAADGGVFAFGNSAFYGSTGGMRLNRPIVGAVPSPSNRGYWFVASDGGIFNYGDSGFYGSTGSLHLNQPIVGMAATPSGHGYWLVATDGGIFNYGDAKFYGSTGALHLAQPVVGMRATGSGLGYWFVARDGGIFSFGDAQFCGSTGRLRLASGIVSLS